MKIRFIQFEPHPHNKQRNLDSIERIVAQTHADILVFPELCTTGAVFTKKKDIETLAEQIPGPTTKIFSRLAWTYRRLLIIGMLEYIPKGDKDEGDGHEKDGYHSTVVAVAPHGILGKAQRTGLSQDEKKFLIEGSESLCFFEWSGARIHLSVSNTMGNLPRVVKS